MNEANITINPKKSTVVEFDLEIVGDTNELKPQVRMLVSMKNNHQVVINCVRAVGHVNSWSCDLMPIGHLEESVYLYTIEVIIDDMYFTPISGAINVNTPYDVSAASREFETRRIPTPQPTRPTMETVTEDDSDLSEKDKKIKNILESRGYSYKKKPNGKLKLSDMLKG